MIAGNSQGGPMVRPGARATERPPAAITAMSAGQRGSRLIAEPSPVQAPVLQAATASPRPLTATRSTA